MKDKERYCKLKKRSVEPALHFTPNEVFVKEIALFFLALACSVYSDSDLVIPLVLCGILFVGFRFRSICQTLCDG